MTVTTTFLEHDQPARRADLHSAENHYFEVSVWDRLPGAKLFRALLCWDGKPAGSQPAAREHSHLRRVSGSSNSANASAQRYGILQSHRKLHRRSNGSCHRNRSITCEAVHRPNHVFQLQSLRQGSGIGADRQATIWNRGSPELHLPRCYATTDQPAPPCRIPRRIWCKLNIAAPLFRRDCDAWPRGSIYE